MVYPGGHLTLKPVFEDHRETADRVLAMTVAGAGLDKFETVADRVVCRRRLA